MASLKVSIAAAGDAKELRARIFKLLQPPHAVTLRVRLGDFAVPGNLVLEKEAIVHARLVRDELNLNDNLAVEFEAASSPALFPQFRGALDVFPGRPGEAILELSGEYDPPFGFGGELFDAALGSLVAQRSVVSFLEEVAGAAAGNALASNARG